MIIFVPHGILLWDTWFEAVVCAPALVGVGELACTKGRLQVGEPRLPAPLVMAAGSHAFDRLRLGGRWCRVPI